MSNTAQGKGILPEDGAASAAQCYQRDFWSKENLKFTRPHYRMEKAMRIINRVAQGRERELLDIGCGPAALMQLLPPSSYCQRWTYSCAASSLRSVLCVHVSGAAAGGDDHARLDVTISKDGPMVRQQ